MATTVTFAGDSDRGDKSGARTLVRNYTLQTDDPAMDSHLASAAFSDETGIYFDPPTAHPTCDGAYCVDIYSELDTNSATTKRIFKVTVTYSNALDTVASGQGGAIAGPAGAIVADQQQGVPPEQRIADPILRTAGSNLVVKSRCSTMKVARYMDRMGKAYKNTLGDPLFPPMESDAPVVVYTFSVNRLLPLEGHYDYVGACNSYALTFPGRIRAWGVETLKLMDVDIQPVSEGGYNFWVHSYTIQSGPYWSYDLNTYLGWVKEVPNVGRRRKIQNKLNANKVEIVPIMDGGVVVSEPRYLDQDGYELGFNVFGESLNLNPAFQDQDIHWLRFHPDRLFRMEGLWL